MEHGFALIKRIFTDVLIRNIVLKTRKRKTVMLSTEKNLQKVDNEIGKLRLSGFHTASLNSSLYLTIPETPFMTDSSNIFTMKASSGTPSH